MLIMRRTLALACTVTACAAAAEPAPRADLWVSYQGATYSLETARTAEGAIRDHGDGFIPQFRIRLRSTDSAAARGNGAVRAPLVDVDPDSNSATGDNAALLLRIATLALPQGSGGSSSAYFRTNRAWRWRYDRINDGAREVAAEIDLAEDRNSPAAAVCRLVEESTVPNLSSDRCRIEAIIDPADGWPLTAVVTRTLAASNGSTTLETVTFERLPARSAGIR